jgi:hypothetical protein
MNIYDVSVIRDSLRAISYPVIAAGYAGEIKIHDKRGFYIKSSIDAQLYYVAVENLQQEIPVAIVGGWPMMIPFEQIMTTLPENVPLKKWSSGYKIDHVNGITLIF